MSREPKSDPHHGRKDNQKMKPYLVMEYLMRNTDENKTVTTEQIIGFLDDLGITAERRSIYKDIEAINTALWALDHWDEFEENAIKEAKIAVKEDSEKFIVYDSKSHGFRVVQRKYTVDEIRLLAECVYSSRYYASNEWE